MPLTLSEKVDNLHDHHRDGQTEVRVIRTRQATQRLGCRVYGYRICLVFRVEG